MFGLGYQELLLVLMVVGVPAALLWMAVHYSKKAPIEPGCAIGGWLILVAVGVCLTPFMIASVMYDALRTTDWSGMAPAQIGFGGALLGLFAAVLLGWGIWNVMLFFGRRRAFPKAWIGLNGTLAALAIVGVVLNPTSAVELAPMLFWTVVWGVYLVKSRRAQATFVRVGRWTGEQPALADQAPDVPVETPMRRSLHTARPAHLYRSLLQRRAVRLTVFVVVLIAVPTLAAGFWSYHDGYATAYRLCPTSKISWEANSGEVRLEYISANRVNQYSSVRCNYSVIVPKAFSDRAAVIPPGQPYPPDMAVELNKLEETGLAWVTGPTSESLPTLSGSFSGPLKVAAFFLVVYVVLFLLVWGVVWVWRGGRRA